jgi:hypothetical protein
LAALRTVVLSCIALTFGFAVPVGGGNGAFRFSVGFVTVNARLESEGFALFVRADDGILDVSELWLPALRNVEEDVADAETICHTLSLLEKRTFG